MRPRAAAAALLGAALLVTIPALRLALVSRGELARGVAAEAAGDARAAQVRYERAARCAFPLNPFAGEALARLAALGRAWEREGRTAHALSAAESVRGILLATGGGHRRRAEAQEAAGRVVRLRLALARAWPDRGAPVPDEAAVRATLARRSAPRAGAALAGMACLAFAALPVRGAIRGWARPDGGRAGLALYGVACLLVAAALALFLLA